MSGDRPQTTPLSERELEIIAMWAALDVINAPHGSDREEIVDEHLEGIGAFQSCRILQILTANLAQAIDELAEIPWVRSKFDEFTAGKAAQMPPRITRLEIPIDGAAVDLQVEGDTQ